MESLVLFNFQTDHPLSPTSRRASHCSDSQWQILGMYMYSRPSSPSLPQPSKSIFDRWARQIFIPLRFLNWLDPLGWSLMPLFVAVVGCCCRDLWEIANSEYFCFAALHKPLWIEEALLKNTAQKGTREHMGTVCSIFTWKLMTTME